MLRRPFIWLPCALALAVGAGYFFLHRGAFSAQHQTVPAVRDTATPPLLVADRTAAANVEPKVNAPLPLPGTPLKDTYANLTARARSGDRAASVRLFHDTAKCRYIDDFHRTLPLIMPMLLAITKPENSDVHDKHSIDMLDTIQRKADWVRKTEPLCEGADAESALDSPDWMRIAAQQGDPEAIDCYLDQNFGDVADAMRHLHWLGDFQRIGPGMAFAAATNGDWKAVYLLAHAYDGGNGMRWLDQSISPNILKAYRYTSLLDMGWPGQDYVQDRLETLADQLTANEVAAAKAWAQDVFANRFHGRLANADDFQHVCPQPQEWQ
jgi:hypothetical protein